MADHYIVTVRMPSERRQVIRDAVDRLNRNAPEDEKISINQFCLAAINHAIWRDEQDEAANRA